MYNVLVSSEIQFTDPPADADLPRNGNGPGNICLQPAQTGARASFFAP